MPLKICLKRELCLEKRFGLQALAFQNLRLQALGIEKCFFVLQVLVKFFGSLQALDSKNQRKKVVCRLRHPPGIPPRVKFAKWLQSVNGYRRMGRIGPVLKIKCEY